MKFLERLDRIVRPIAIPNLTQIIIAGQVLMFFASAGKPEMLLRGMLIWDKVLEGEVWRLLTFLFIPITTSALWLFFALYIFYIFGTGLERLWGVVRYNTYLWLGLILTLIAAGVTHSSPVAGAFLEGTVFLAFATLNPNYTLQLFFILPVKVKWLAWLQAAFYSLAIVGGDWSVKLTVLASVGNYLIFFAPTVIAYLQNRKRRKVWEARQFDPGTEARHTCTVCGVNSKMDPKMDFRYCSKCEGTHAYCEDHLRDHVHKTS